MNSKGQGHSLTLAQCHPDSTFSNFFSLETAKPIKVNFHVKLPCSNGHGHMTKMASMPIYGKNLKIVFSGIRPRWLPCPYMKKKLKIVFSGTKKVDDLESWYAASDTRVLPSLFKRWLGWTWPFFRQGQIWSPMLLYMEKGKTMAFSETILVGRCSQLNEYMKLYEYQRWSSFTNLGPRSLIQHFQTSFPKKTLGHLKPNFIWSLHGWLCWKFVQMFRVTWPRWLPV